MRDGCIAGIVLWGIVHVPLSSLQVISQHLSCNLLPSLVHILGATENEECDLSAF